MRNAIAAIIALLLVLPALASALGAAEADARAAPLLGDQARDAIRLGQNQPLAFAGTSYWLYYLDISTPTQIIIVISDVEGNIVEDNNTLNSLAHLAYHNDQLRLASVRRAGINDYSAFLEALQPAIQDLPQRVESTLVPLDNKYPELQLGVTLVPLAQRAHDEWADSRDRVGDGIALQEQYSRTQDSADLELLYNHYNSTQESIDSLLKALAIYQQGVTAKSNNASARYTGANRTEIIQALQSIYNLGDYSAAKLRFDSARAEFSSRAASEDAWVARAVENFVFRKTRADALAQYDALKPTVNDLLQNEAVLLSAGVNVTQLKKTWSGIESIVLKPAASLSQYNTALQLLSQAQTLAADANSKYQAYLRAQEKPAAPATQQTDYTTFVIGIIVIAIIAFVAYRYLKRRREEGGEALPAIPQSKSGGLYG